MATISISIISTISRARAISCTGDPGPMHQRACLVKGRGGANQLMYNK
jgi:hypothetical protein